VDGWSPKRVAGSAGLEAEATVECSTEVETARDWRRRRTSSARLRRRWPREQQRGMGTGQLFVTGEISRGWEHERKRFVSSNPIKIPGPATFHASTSRRLEYARSAGRSPNPSVF
jgi:hypothetical protein